jgi:hypothetical protein
MSKILFNGSVGINVNNVEGDYFETGKGLRQGDPLSPILFNFVVDVLFRMLSKAIEHNLIKGLGRNIIPHGVECLQYADDIIIFIDKDLEKAGNLKWILSCFELMSGMRINYTKSELVPMNLEEQEIVGIVEIFGCPVGAFPIKYLGVPLHYQKLRREVLQPLVDKILKKIAGWKGKLLSHAGRVMLIKTCLSSIPVYLMSFFKFPKWALDLLNSHMSACLWNDYEGHGKIYLANWHLVSMKEYGGLGVPNLRDLNMALLGSWVKSFIKGEGKLWHSIISQKYIRNAVDIFCLPYSQPSNFWSGVMWAAKALTFGYRWKIGDGSKIRFWEDTWFATAPPSSAILGPYCICDQIGIGLADVWDGSEVKLTFRRNFSEAIMDRWYELVGIVTEVTYDCDGDALVWQYDSKGTYTFQSLYAVINFKGVIPVFIPAIWKVKVPPKIHIFLWLVSHNKIMTIANLLKRGIVKPEACLFCTENETVNHLLFECVVAKKIWLYVEIFSGVNFVNYESVAGKWINGKNQTVLTSFLRDSSGGFG